MTGGRRSPGDIISEGLRPGGREGRSVEGLVGGEEGIRRWVVRGSTVGRESASP